MKITTLNPLLLLGSFALASLLPTTLAAQDPALEAQEREICSHATSGVNLALCNGLDQDRQRPGWQRRIDAARETAGIAARPAWEALQKAADRLIPADGALIAAVNRGGSGYAGFLISGETRRHEAFVTTLERYTHARAPRATPDTLRSADGALNEAYKARRAKMRKLDLEIEMVSPAEPILREAQRAWIPYRDAWIAYYRLRWQGEAPPEVLEEEIAAALTRERAKEIAELGIPNL